MFPRLAYTVCLVMVTFPTTAQAQASLSASVQQQLPSLTETYKHLHRNPELSHHEDKTSAYLAAELRKAGYTVTEHVGGNMRTVFRRSASWRCSRMVRALSC